MLQFSAEDKIELAKYLDKLTLKSGYEKFISSIKELPISFEDLTAEVETVRKERAKYSTK